MTEASFGPATLTQVGIIVHDIEAAARAWSQILVLPMPSIIITDTVEAAHTEYQGQPTTARAKLAFFKMGQVDIELIERVCAGDSRERVPRLIPSPLNSATVYRLSAAQENPRSHTKEREGQRIVDDRG